MFFLAALFCAVGALVLLMRGHGTGLSKSIAEPASPTPVPTIRAASTPRAVSTPDSASGNAGSRSAFLTAKRQQDNGDYDTANNSYRALIGQFPGSEEAKEATLLIGQIQLADGDRTAAAATFRQFLSGYPADGRIPTATFLLATVLEASGDRAASLETYRRYASLAGVLAPYAAIKLADLYLEGRDYAGAVSVLRDADSADLPPTTRVEIVEKLGRAEEGLGSFSAAGVHYQQAQGLAEEAEKRAALTYRIAAVAAKAGDLSKAVQIVLELVANEPETTAARQALRLLDQLAPGTVSPLTRGFVLYNAGEYSAAVDAFAEQIDTAPDSPFSAEARYYAGRAHQVNGDCEQAIVVYERLTTSYPESPRLPQASLQRGRCLAAVGRTTAALEVLSKTATQHEGTDAAADALWEAATLLDEQGQLSDAAEQYRMLAAGYTGHRRAADAQFRQGFNYWRLNRDQQAVAVWDGLAQSSAEPAMHTKALFWAGKALLDMGKQDAAKERFIGAAASKDDDYYAARARTIATERLSLQFDLPAGPVTQSGDEASRLERWALQVAGRPDSEAADSVGSGAAILRADTAFLRGEMLLAIGLRWEALREFYRAEATHRDDLAWLVRFATYAREHGLQSASIDAAERALALSGLNGLYAAPRELQTLIFPTYYEEIARAEALRNGVDLWLLFALIRQESMFEPAARSSADARGLTQVIPDTARAIAEALGRDDFQLRDLYKPIVSIAFGAWYLEAQLRNFDGNVLYALAGYNGGASNAERWRTRDHDAYVENIDFSETRAYVRLVSGFHEAYRRIYERL